MRSLLEAHIGDLILWSFCVLALIAYTLTLLMGHADQTLGNVLMTALGALGGYMVKKFATGRSTTTNVESATNVEVNPVSDETKIGE